MKRTHEWNREALLQSPLFAPLHPIFADLMTSSFPTLQDCNALLDGTTSHSTKLPKDGNQVAGYAARHPSITVHSGMPLRFVAQQRGKLSFEAQYEPRCYLTGEVQMRADNWHDLLNALVWLTFPKTKAVLNARHYLALMEERALFQSRIETITALASSSASSRTKSAVFVASSSPPCSHSHSKLELGNTGRGAVRDVNTLLDESGVIVVYADAELGALLRDFQWKELFWQRRDQVRAGHFDGLRTGMGFYLFGHGLYEKALQPYVGMTGQGLLLPVDPEFFSWPPTQQLTHLDSLLADYLSAPEHCRSTRDFSPVPLLGVPGWAADNDCAAYYDNTAYFRPGRRG